MVNSTGSSSFQGIIAQYFVNQEYNTLHKSGEKVIVSGIYDITDQFGFKLGYEQVTCVEGEPFPPLIHTGLRFRLNTKTNHKRYF